MRAKLPYDTDTERDQFIAQQPQEAKIVQHINVDGSKELYVDTDTPVRTSVEERLQSIEQRLSTVEGR